MSVGFRQFLALLVWDFKLQQRYYIWLAGLSISVVWSVLFMWVPESTKSLWLPVLLFTDTCTVGVMFIAGLILLERQQGTLSAVSAMPVPTWAWLASKILSLSIFCTVLATAIIIFHDASVNWLLLVPAIFLGALVYTVIGFLLVCPFQKLTNFFLAMSLGIGACGLPVLGFVDIYEHGLMWLLPTMPLLNLLAAGFDGNTVSGGLFWISLLLMLLWIGLSFYLSIKAFHRYISQRHGS